MEINHNSKLICNFIGFSLCLNVPPAAEEFTRTKTNSRNQHGEESVSKTKVGLISSRRSFKPRLSLFTEMVFIDRKLKLPVFILIKFKFCCRLPSSAVK